jgi:hypothetical protein
MCRARLACLSPAGSSRCRVVRPEEAGIRAAAQIFANAASFLSRWMFWPAVTSSCFVFHARAQISDRAGLDKGGVCGPCACRDLESLTA